MLQQGDLKLETPRRRPSRLSIPAGCCLQTSSFLRSWFWFILGLFPSQSDFIIHFPTHFSHHENAGFCECLKSKFYFSLFDMQSIHFGNQIFHCAADACERFLKFLP